MLRKSGGGAFSLAKVRRDARTITENNTGVPTGTTLTEWTGSRLFNTPGQVITDKLFTIGSAGAAVTVSAPGVVFRRCRFDCTPPAPGQISLYWPIVLTNTPAGNMTSFIDCDHFMNGVAGGPTDPGVFSGFAPSACVLAKDRWNGFKLTRCHITGGHDGVQLVGRNILIESSYIHDLRIFYQGDSVSHNDCMQASNMGHANVRIVGNRMDATTAHTCMQISPNGPDIGFPNRRHENLLIAANYFNGGGYSLSGVVNGGNATLGTEIVNMTVRDNWFGLACKFGPHMPDRDVRCVWTNNRWAATGRTKIDVGGQDVVANEVIP